jgi:hypothetical protein
MLSEPYDRREGGSLTMDEHVIETAAGRGKRRADDALSLDRAGTADLP